MADPDPNFPPQPVPDPTPYVPPVIVPDSTMHIPGWLHLIEAVAPLVLSATPLAPLAPYVSLGIQTAEQIPGATNAQKLEIAKAIAKVGVAATNAQAGHPIINVEAADTLVTAGITAVIAATNLKQQDPALDVQPVTL